MDEEEKVVMIVLPETPPLQYQDLKIMMAKCKEASTKRMMEEQKMGRWLHPPVLLSPEVMTVDGGSHLQKTMLATVFLQSVISRAGKNLIFVFVNVRF